MALDLDYHIAPKEFFGKNTQQMPKLLASGRVPISVYGLMKARLDVLREGVPDSVRNNYWNNYFDTGDGAAYDTEGNMKIVPDAQLLRTINPQSHIINGALVLPEGSYELLPGTLFTKTELQQHTGRWLRKGEPQENPVWNTLARNDQELLEAYETAAFEIASQYGHNIAMGIFLDSPSAYHKMRAWYVGGGNYLSGAYGDVNLGKDSGRLVGVAPEAHAGRKTERPTNGIVAPSLEQVLALGIEHVSRARKPGYEADAKKLFGQ